MGDQPRVTAALLQAPTHTVHNRLSTREQGDSLHAHAERSRAAAVKLDAEAGPTVHRLDTEGRTPQQVALQMSALLSWTE